MTIKERVQSIYELAGWQSDDSADPSNQSPEDNVAHINGLIRQECLKILRAMDRREDQSSTLGGLDCRKAHNEYMRSKSTIPWSEWQKLCPPIAEYDHIIPFSEGGLTVLKNIRTLCTVCHKKRTAEWAAFKARQRRAPARQQVEMNLQ